MPWDSTHKDGLLKAAIVLYGERGYKGVTTRDLAASAGCATGSVYRLYGSKEKLYLHALKDITTRAESELGKIFGGLYADKKNHDVRYFIGEASKRWYSSLDESAKFVQQVLIGDSKRRDAVLAAIGQLITTLAATLQEKTKSKAELDARESVETLVWCLFQYKIRRPSGQSTKEEMDEIHNLINRWLDLAVPKR